jgi:sugar-specific transcriptional regulator TrmB
MGSEKVRKVLKSFGLTEKETELYIFLAKHGALRSGEIAKGIKTHRVEVYRLLKSLQIKGVIEATLEMPKRYTTVLFEDLLESLIKAKQEETALIETTKQSVLNDWKIISKIQPETFLEKFTVVEGNKKIYGKILQMVNATKNHLSTMAKVSGLARAHQFGVFEAAFNHPLKSQIRYRFLTDLSEQTINPIKELLKKAYNTGFDFKARNPDLGLKLFPNMITRDDEEVLFFISPRTDKSEQNDKCLWTNCKSLVQAFSTVFDELWRNSTDLQSKIEEIENPKSTPRKPIVEDAKITLEKYENLIRSAEKEIIIMTSAQNLKKIWNSREYQLQRFSSLGVSIRIMAPITKDNFGAAKDLSKFCEVRHVAASQLATTVIDNKYLFQFETSSPGEEELEYASPPFYSEDFEYVGKVKVMLDDLWRNARTPSPITLEALTQSPINRLNVVSDDCYTASKPDSPYQKMLFPIIEKPRAITEQEVINKIRHAKKQPVKNPLKDKAVFYGKQSSAVIHPPAYLNLPDMIITLSIWNEKSTPGAQNWLMIQLWLDTPKGKAFVPVAHVRDSGINLEASRAAFAGYPLVENLQEISKVEFQVQAYGNIRFAGWTRPIPLIPPKYILPPSCILFEGYGKIKPGVIITRFPSGFLNVMEYNGMEAFVTFFHPASKYSGPGTDGTMNRELIMTIKPP